MPDKIREAPNEQTGAQVLQSLRRIWDSLVIGTDSDAGLLQLPVLQLRCLRRIAAEDGQRMVDIAHRMQMPLPGTSRLVDRLVRRGMVARQPDPHDRRVVRVALTPVAKSGLAEIERKRQLKMDSCLRNLDPDVVARLLESLQLVANVAEQASAHDRPRED